MKFTNYLKQIDNVSIYPIISLILFTSIFVFVTIYVYSTDKKKLDDHANIPLK